jgi:hypothetical protein
MYIQKQSYSLVLSCHQSLGQNKNIRITNELFENVAKFKYLGRALTNQNDIHDEIKSRLNLRNACYHSLQNFLSLSHNKNQIRIGGGGRINTQTCNFASCAVWVQNLVSHFEGGTQTEGF